MTVFLKRFLLPNGVLQAVISRLEMLKRLPEIFHVVDGLRNIYSNPRKKHPLSNKGYALFKAGNDRARYIMNMARWPNLPPSTYPHVNQSLPLDVMVVPISNVSTKLHEEAKRFFALDNRKIMCPQILHLNFGWPVIRRSTLVVVESNDKESYMIISLYITSDCDGRIGYVLENADKVQSGMKEYNKRVQFNTKSQLEKLSSRYHSQPPGRAQNGWGHMEMDGIFRFRFSKGYGYYHRSHEANKDHDFLYAQTSTFCGMSYMESRHVPAIHSYRNALVAGLKGFPGIFPGIPVSWCPAMAVGSSNGYACDAHDDSAVKGITESIFWTKAKGPIGLSGSDMWCFANIAARVMFDLRYATRSGGGCCLYIPGNVSHATLPTGCKEHVVHKGMGFVLINKHALAGPKCNEWFAQNGKKLVMKGSPS